LSQPVSYEPLHHKYRPQTFADLVGQAAISTTLSHAIQLRRIAPAYLFTGPRGTGKTSSARILAKSLNCISGPNPTPEPCGVCEVCYTITKGNALDVVEIDAASNTGVDNIRELIERAQFAPVQCRYKIYCLDEVHMLSTAAFNALLKTLEEPPDRVVFILATTDPQRVLPTIISRCQRFDFRRIPLQDMIAHLGYIAQKEDIAIAPTALELVAQIAQGGLRDAESLLDQLSLLAGEITVERVWDLVGSVPEQDLLALCEAIAAANPEVILERTRYLLDRGREPLIVLQNLTGFYRDLLIAKTAPNRRDLVALTENTWVALCQFVQAIDLNTLLAGQQHLRTCEVQVKNTTQPRLWLEVTLLGLIPHTPVQAIMPVQAGSVIPSVSLVAASPVPPLPSPSPPVKTNGHGAPIQPSAASRPVVPVVPEPEAFLDPTPSPLPTVNPEPIGAKGGAIAPELDLDQLWQTLLEHLNRPSRALLSQHGQLLFFQGREAQIGIRNGSLARIAQSKLPDVEAAFLKVFNRKVGVSLQIMTATAPAEPSETVRVESSVPATKQPPPIIETPSPAPVVSSFSSVAEAPPLPALAQMPTPIEHNPPEAPAPSWETFDELTHAARNFAQFFNGALVNVEGTDGPEVERLTPTLEEKLDGADWDEPETP
jgi:DNA polymerase-3 subunit gamma/tau